MGRFDRLLYRVAQPVDKAALRARPGLGTTLAVIARVALRFFPLYIAALVLGLVLSLGAGADIYHRTEMPRFCGACHEMDTNFDAWAQSQHGGITCVDCHARPGLSGWVAAKAAGTSQLLTHFTADSIEDIRLEQHHKDIVSANCQRCHEGAARLNERDGLIISHERHAELGLQCVSCHAGNIAHPDTAKETEAKPAGLVDLALCFKCHDGEQTIKDKTAFAATDEQRCDTCHPDSRLALQHGADTSAGQHRKPCLDCHDHTEGRHYQMDPKNEAALCRKCHDAPKGLQSKHKPFAEQRCSLCHRVMSPSHLYRTGPRPTAAFCLGCHDELARTLTAKGTFVPTGFATWSQPDDDDVDLHRSHGGERARVSMVVGAGTGPNWRAVVADLTLDGREFQRLFGHFQTQTWTRLQLLDSRGVALASTDRAELYKSAVHGTYFSDRLRQGGAVQMRCHSCHQNEGEATVREAELTTVAPIPGTGWSVAIRAAESKVFAPLQRAVVSRVLLFSVLLGVFLGFFVLL